MSYFTIRKIDAIASTNEALKSQYQQENIRHGEVLWALDQTHGKGQRNSKWVSQAGKNLTFSIYIDHEFHVFISPFHLNCLIALSIRKLLIQLKIAEISVKWPNDIMSGDKKICGILIENIFKKSILRASIIGVGLNVNQNHFENLFQASSMSQISGLLYDLDEVINCFLDQL